MLLGILLNYRLYHNILNSLPKGGEIETTALEAFIEAILSGNSWTYKMNIPKLNLIAPLYTDFIFNFVSTGKEGSWLAIIELYRALNYFNGLWQDLKNFLKVINWCPSIWCWTKYVGLSLHHSVWLNFILNFISRDKKNFSGMDILVHI